MDRDSLNIQLHPGFSRRHASQQASADDARDTCGEVQATLGWELDICSIQELLRHTMADPGLRSMLQSTRSFSPA